MGSPRLDDLEADATLPGGDSVNSALPFDPQAATVAAPTDGVNAPSATTLPSWSGTMIGTLPDALKPATPFSQGAGPRPKAPPSVGFSPVGLVGPIASSLRRTTALPPVESPEWLRINPDPTRRERPFVAPPPPVPVRELQQAAQLGVVAVSNAAASSGHQLPATAPIAAPQVRYLDDNDGSEARFEPIDILFAPSSPTPAIRQLPQTKASSCCAPRSAFRSPESKAPKDTYAATQHAMCHAASRSGSELHHELVSALSRGEAPPTIATVGTLTVLLDELEHFRATLALAQAFLGADPSHTDLIAQANRVNGVASDLPSESLVHVRTRLEEALRRATKGPQLELSRDKNLVERRKFAEVQVLGERRIRATLRGSNGGEVPCYLPASAGAALPLSRTFPAIVIATVRAAPDRDLGPVCLDVLALGRNIKE